MRPEALQFIRDTVTNGGPVTPEMLADVLAEVDRLGELEEATHASLKRWITACGIARSERDGLRAEIDSRERRDADRLDAAFDCPTCPARGVDPCVEVVDALGSDPVWAECSRHPDRKFEKAARWTVDQQRALAAAVWWLRAAARHGEADALIANFPPRPAPCLPRVPFKEAEPDAVCGRLLIGEGTDTWDPVCQMKPGHTEPCEPTEEDKEACRRHYQRGARNA